MQCNIPIRNYSQSTIIESSYPINMDWQVCDVHRNLWNYGQYCKGAEGSKPAKLNPIRNNIIWIRKRINLTCLVECVCWCKLKYSGKDEKDNCKYNSKCRPWRCKKIIRTAFVCNIYWCLRYWWYERSSGYLHMRIARFQSKHFYWFYKSLYTRVTSNPHHPAL